MRSKECPAELRDRIVLRQIWGRLQKNIVLCRRFTFGLHETIRTLPRSSLLAKLSNQRRRVLVREVIKTLMATLVELHDLIWRWEKHTEEQTSLWHSTNLGLMAKWPNSSFSSVKIHSNSDWNLQKYTQNNSQTMKKKRFSGLMNLNSLFMSEGNQAPLITYIIPSQRWSMVEAASCSGNCSPMGG